MAQVRIRYLHEVGGELHYRRRVPEDLKGIVGKSEWKHALGLCRGQEHHAARLVAEYDVAYAQLIARERIRLMTGAVIGSAPFALQPAAEAKPKKVVKLSEAYAYDLETHGAGRDEKVFSVAVNSMIDLIGDQDILNLSPRKVQEWIRACEERGNKASTIKRRVDALRAIVSRYLHDHEIERNNPFAKLGVKKETAAKADRLPFHSTHLKRIDHYIAHHPTLRDISKELLILIKMTGARPLEIGGLDCEDVLLDHDVPHIWIRQNAHRRIKTKGSERRIPLVGEALEMARSAKLRAGSGSLFPEACHNTNSLSQRLNKIIRRAGVPKSPRLVVYSFRHSIEEAMRVAGLPEHTQKRIMGHTDSSMTGRYGAPAGELGELRLALKKAITKLGVVEKSIYSGDELNA